jgi:hypothetical protein
MALRTDYTNLHPVFHLLSIVCNVDADVLDPIRGGVDEFGKIDRTVRGRGVIDQDGRAVIAVGVNVR